MVVVLLLDSAQLQAQQPASPYASESIQNAQRSIETILRTISEKSLSPVDGTVLDSVDALRMALELAPEGRRRFVLPRQFESGKIGADKLKKLLETSGVWLEFQSSLESLCDGIEKAIVISEANRDWESGYRMRWQLSGLQSIFPITSSSKRVQSSTVWAYADALKSSPKVSRSYSNHPKTLWPAGSFSVVTTAHFEISVQTSEVKAATEVAVLCEQAFSIWKQVFFSFWKGEQTVAPDYPEPASQKYSVVLFRNREAYVKALRAIPEIGVSTGYYDPNLKLSLFYWDGNKTPSTVVHELTHQFFFETGVNPVALDTNRAPGFWVVEGAALYMESLSARAIGGGLVVDIGGWDAPRLQAARYRRLHDKYWVPWDEFHKADGNRIRGEEDIRAWYSQAAGLAHLFLDGTKQNEIAFVRYLASVYSNSETSALLGDWNDDQKLRDEYDRYLIFGPSSLPKRPYFSNRREAVLCRSKLSSRQLLEWPIELRTTPWLDLSFSQIDDELFVDREMAVAPIWNVQRLNLESTKVTDLSMQSIAASNNLSELDLSQCSITDVGLSAFKGHKTLKTLWLSQCMITDKSIDVLLSLPQLDAAHLSKTQISRSGWDRLIASKPRLKLKSTPP